LKPSQWIIYNMSEQVKAQIIEAGFELRTGHQTISCADYAWQSVDGKDWTYVIVHKLRPQVQRIAEWSRGLYTTDINGNNFPEKWIVGYGTTEDEAWLEATTYWDVEVKIDALSGL
jgi:hypothetical protein